MQRKTRSFLEISSKESNLISGDYKVADIVLINPYFSGYVSIPTLGLGYLAGYIKKHSDHKATVIEPLLEQLSKEDVLARVRDADYVGLTCYTENRFQCFDFADLVKKSYPHVEVVVGGPHASIFPEMILEHVASIDYVIRLEGEQTLVELLDGKERSNIKGLSFRAHSKICSNEDRPPLVDLAEIYYPYADSMSFLKVWQDRETPKELLKVKHIPIMASRGCPHKCAFCGANNLGYGRWRGIPPEQVVDAMAELHETYNIGYFRFYDPLFYPNNNDLERFCKALEEKRLPISFRVDVRAGTSEETLQRLYNVGCRVVGFGVESGSDEMLEFLNKKTSRAVIEETIQTCRKIGLWTIGFFMTSMPKESSLFRAITKPLYDKFDVFNLQFFMVQPGTPLYENIKSQYRIDDDIWFDRSHLDHIYFCRENFYDATWSSPSVKKNIRLQYYRFNCRHPIRVMKRRGIVLGITIAALSGILLLLNQLPVLSNLYSSLRLTQGFLRMKKWMNRSGIELYG